LSRSENHYQLLKQKEEITRIPYEHSEVVLFAEAKDRKVKPMTASNGLNTKSLIEDRCQEQFPVANFPMIALKINGPG
jgi:hypothetical protein